MKKITLRAIELSKRLIRCAERVNPGSTNINQRKFDDAKTVQDYRRTVLMVITNALGEKTDNHDDKELKKLTEALGKLDNVFSPLEEELVMGGPFQLLRSLLGFNRLPQIKSSSQQTEKRLPVHKALPFQITPNNLR